MLHYSFFLFTFAFDFARGVAQSGWEQGVEGSNPFTPTLVDDVEQALFACSTFFFIALTCISIWLCFS